MVPGQSSSQGHMSTSAIVSFLSLQSSASGSEHDGAAQLHANRSCSSGERTVPGCLSQCLCYFLPSQHGLQSWYEEHKLQSWCQWSYLYCPVNVRSLLSRCQAVHHIPANVYIQCRLCSQGTHVDRFCRPGLQMEFLWPRGSFIRDVVWNVLGQGGMQWNLGAEGGIGDGLAQTEK